jgi:hypothetical protein
LQEGIADAADAVRAEGYYAVTTRYYGLFLRNLDPGERGQIRSPHGLSAEARPS